MCKNSEAEIIEKKVSKGFAKYALKKKLNHQDYKYTLEICGIKEDSMNILRSHNHMLSTKIINKICLSANNNK